MTLPEEYKNALNTVEGVARNYDVDWAVTGSIGRSLQGMELEEDQPDIDIVTDEESLELLYQELQEYSETDISYDAEIESDKLSFHKFEAEIEDVEIEFLGDFKVNGEPVYENYQPNNVEVEGVQVPTVPLKVEAENGRGELEGNRETGRNEIADKIEAFLSEKK